MAKTEKRQKAAERNLRKIQSELWDRDRYELVAEKSAELGYAAMMVLRADGFSEAGTKMTCEESHDYMRDKVLEVMMAITVLGYDLNELVANVAESSKWAAWRGEFCNRPDSKIG